MDNRVKRLLVEANEITQYLKKDYIFEADDETNSSNVKISSKSLQIDSILSVNLFKDKLVVLRKLMYEDPSDSNSKKADQLIQQACHETSTHPTSTTDSTHHPIKNDVPSIKSSTNNHSTNNSKLLVASKLIPKDPIINHNTNSRNGKDDANICGNLNSISGDSSELKRFNSKNDIQIKNITSDSNLKNSATNFSIASKNSHMDSDSRLSLNNNNNVQLNKFPPTNSNIPNSNGYSLTPPLTTTSSMNFNNNYTAPTTSLSMKEGDVMKNKNAGFTPKEYPRVKSLRSYKMMTKEQFHTSDSNINIQHHHTIDTNPQDTIHQDTTANIASTVSQTTTTNFSMLTTNSTTTSAGEEVFKSSLDLNVDRNKNDNIDIINNKLNVEDGFANAFTDYKDYNSIDNLSLHHLHSRSHHHSNNHNHIHHPDNHHHHKSKSMENNGPIKNLPEPNISDVKNVQFNANKQFYFSCGLLTSMLKQRDLKLMDPHDQALHTCHTLLNHVTILETMRGLNAHNEIDVHTCMDIICQLNILEFTLPHIFKHHHHHQCCQLNTIATTAATTITSSNNSLQQHTFNDSNKHIDVHSDDNDDISGGGGVDSDVDHLHECRVVFRDLLQGFSMFWKILSFEKASNIHVNNEGDIDEDDDDSNDKPSSNFNKFNFEKLKNLLHYIIQAIGRHLIINNVISNGYNNTTRWNELSSEVMNWLLLGCDDALLKKIESSLLFINKQLDCLLDCVSSLANDERVNKHKVTLTQNVHQLINIILQHILLIKQIQMELQKLMVNNSSLDTMHHSTTSSSSTSINRYSRYISRVSIIFNRLLSTLNDIHSFCPSFISSILDMDMTMLTTKRLLRYINHLESSLFSLATSCYRNLDDDAGLRGGYDNDKDDDDGDEDINVFDMLSQDQVEVLQEMQKLLESCFESLKNNLQDCVSFNIMDNSLSGTKNSNKQQLLQQQQPSHYTTSSYGGMMNQQHNMLKQQLSLSASFNKASFKRVLPATPQEIMKQQLQQLQDQKQSQHLQQHHSPPTQQQYSTTQHLISNRDNNETTTSVMSKKIQKHFSLNQTDPFRSNKLSNPGNLASKTTNNNNNATNKLPSNNNNDYNVINNNNNKQPTNNIATHRFSEHTIFPKANKLTNKTSSTQNLSTIVDDFNNNSLNNSDSDNIVDVNVARRKPKNNIQRYYANRHSYMQ